ncbi:MAG: hypothetical protein HPY76_08980 [Anaerolineae bacterium]|nr:hypothetical protein [Anaerolineae bacterium]
MSEERLMILKMVEEGKITPDEAIGLLNTLDKAAKAEKAQQFGDHVPPEGSSRTGKYLRIRVTDAETDKVRTNIRMPLSMVSAGIKMGMRFTPEIEGMQLGELQDFINTGVTGQVIDIIDEKDGEHVEIYIE